MKTSKRKGAKKQYLDLNVNTVYCWFFNYVFLWSPVTKLKYRVLNILWITKLVVKLVNLLIVHRMLLKIISFRSIFRKVVYSLTLVLIELNYKSNSVKNSSPEPRNPRKFLILAIFYHAKNGFHKIKYVKSFAI